MKQRDARTKDIDHAMAALRPRVEQGNVRLIDSYPNAARYMVRLDGTLLSTIVEVECIDGELWGHLSVAGQKPQRIPTWSELRWCKEYFLGDRKAVQVLPPRAEYVNINPDVLHLYAPLERDPLPDFREPDGAGGYSI